MEYLFIYEIYTKNKKKNFYQKRIKEYIKNFKIYKKY